MFCNETYMQNIIFILLRSVTTILITDTVSFSPNDKFLWHSFVRHWQMINYLVLIWVFVNVTDETPILNEGVPIDVYQIIYMEKGTVWNKYFWEFSVSIEITFEINT